MNADIHPCPPAERSEALEVLYRRIASTQRAQLIADVLHDASQGQIDLSGLWIARRRGRVIAAMLTQGMAGRAAAVWAPEVAISWGRASLAVALIRAALDDLASRGFVIAQALLDDSAPRHSSIYLSRAALPHITDLVYMGRPASLPLAIDPSLPAFVWQAYGPKTEGEFREVLQATYTDSLDMPELEGIRSLDDILASHRAGGRFAPERWQVGRLAAEPEAAAILLLSDLPDREAWEVAYLGLTPAARGRGLGRAALAHALELARPHTRRIELAVDARNRPARRLYEATGFTPFDRRAVHLAALGALR